MINTTIKKTRKSRFKLFDSLPKFAKNSFTISFVISFIVLVSTIVFFIISQPEIPLFYSLPRSDQQLVYKLWIFFIPFLSWFISIVHLLIIKLMPDLKVRAAQLFSYSTVVLQIVLLFVFLRIIIIVS